MDFSLRAEVEIGDNAFVLHTDGEEKEYNVPCVFQIWSRTESKRNKSHRNEPNDLYSFSKSLNEAQISFRRVGVYAGKSEIINKDTKLSEQSHYFIKTLLDPKTLCENLNSIKWPSNNTVGPRSISKNDLIRELNQLTEKR